MRIFLAHVCMQVLKAYEQELDETPLHQSDHPSHRPHDSSLPIPLDCACIFGCRCPHRCPVRPSSLLAIQTSRILDEFLSQTHTAVYVKSKTHRHSKFCPAAESHHTHIPASGFSASRPSFSSPVPNNPPSSSSSCTLLFSCRSTVHKCHWHLANPMHTPICMQCTLVL
jgi:hypothetical protein